MKRVIPILFFAFAALSINAQLVISEISYNPPESGTDSLEYIELYNSTTEEIDLSGYIIEDNAADTILTGTIAASGYAILAINPTAIMTVLGVEAIEIERIATNNGGERIAISSPSGVLIDEVTYSDDAPWPTFADGTDGAGATIELCDLTSDNTEGANWGASTNDLNVMVDGKAFLGTPNAANSSTCEFVPDYTVEVSNNIFTPADLTINVGESVRWVNVQGFHNVNGSQSTYPDNPVGFRNGDAASGAWMFDFTFDIEGVYDYQCDPHVGVGMVGTVTVMGDTPPAIPTYDISVVNTENGDGLADSLFVQCILEGVVHGANLRADGHQFSIIDESGDAIGLFSGTDLGYTYAEGDLIRATGEISQFRGFTQITATAIELISSDNALQVVSDVSELNEDTEAKLVQTVPVYLADGSQWAGDGTSFNATFVTSDGTEINLRVDSDTEVASWAGPGEGTVADLVITGISGQFDNSDPLTGGYQLFPRYISDFTFILSNDNELQAEVSVFPNPVTSILNITSDITPDAFTIYNQWGEVVSQGGFTKTLDVTNIASGNYVLVLKKGDKTKAIQFVR